MGSQPSSLVVFPVVQWKRKCVTAVLLVEQSIEPIVGKVVIAKINCALTLKRLSVVDGQMTLTADNRGYPDLCRSTTLTVR